MRPQMLVVALAGLSMATAAAAAEPAKAPVRKADQPAETAAPVVAAAAVVADAGEQAASDPQATPPAKQRRARVTTCRCGDQNPSD